MRRLMLCAAVLLFCAASPVWGADTIKVGEIATVTGDFAAYGIAEVESVDWCCQRYHLWPCVGG